MRVLRFLYVTFAYGVTLIVGLYLVLNLGGFVSAQVKRHTLGGEITDRIIEVVPTSQQFVDPVADRVDVEPTHSWTAQHCDFRTNDSGWIAIDYREVCTLESAHAWQVDDEATARALLGEQVPNETPQVYGPCHTYRDTDAAYAEGVTFLYIEPAAEVDRWCAPIDREYAERRPVTGELPGLDNSQGWLIVVEDIELVDEVIGCARWTVVFCTNPFGDRPAWGDPA